MKNIHVTHYLYTSTFSMKEIVKVFPPLIIGHSMIELIQRSYMAEINTAEIMTEINGAKIMIETAKIITVNIPSTLPSTYCQHTVNMDISFYIHSLKQFSSGVFNYSYENFHFQRQTFFPSSL